MYPIWFSLRIARVHTNIFEKSSRKERLKAMRSIPLNHHKTPAEMNPILASQSRKYHLRQRAAINIRPRPRNQDFGSVIPGSIGHPEFDPNTWSAFSIPRFLIKYKVFLLSIASLVSLIGISTLYRATNKTSKAGRSSVLPSYTRSKLAVDRLTQEQEANKAKKTLANVPISTAKDPASALATKTSILDTLNSMGLMEEKHTAESVGSVLLMVQDAEITSSTAATTDSLNSTESLGSEDQQHHYKKEEDYATTEIQNTSNVSHTTLILLSPTEQQLALQHQSQVKATVAYVITIQDCNLNEPIWDGAAVLARSIIINSIGSPSSSKTKAPSKYGYKLFAIVHIDASTQEPNENEETTDHKTSDSGLSVCVKNLAMLGYEVLIRDNPIHPHEIQNEGYLKSNIQDRIKDYIKLYAYTLTDYPIVVLLDVVTFLLNPLDELFDAMLEKSGSAEAKAAKEMINFHETGSNTFPDVIDAYFTRDYTTLQPTNSNSKVAGVQYGFLIIKPSNEVFDDIINIIEEGKYARDVGWGHKGYGNYLGAMTTKGLLS
jgi:hypothetical protein